MTFPTIVNMGQAIQTRTKFLLITNTDIAPAMTQSDHPFLGVLVDLLQKSHPDQPREDLEKELLRAATPAVHDKPMAPPWVAFPNIDSFPSIGWRMGPGEDYLDAFSDWLTSLTQSEITEYQRQHPEPEKFRGVYTFILERQK